MTGFRDVLDGQRYEQDVTGPDGGAHRVWADYAAQGDRRVITHVEADEALRGSGAAGRFMQAMADHARAHGLTLTPRCGYAAAWFKRHPEQGDLIG